MKMARRLRIGCFVGLTAFVGGTAIADPPPTPKNFWRNTNYFNHYVLYERATNTYVETVDCKPLWRFTKVGGNLNEVILRDEGRKLNVKISYDGMYLKADNQAAYQFYQK